MHEYAYNNTPGAPIAIGQTALPVELMRFSAVIEEATVRLDWATASEQNNAGFEVQRSEDGKTFRTLQFIEGNGTTHETQEYLYDDKALRTGQQYYYRLKQIDYNGEFEYSKIITAALKGQSAQASDFYPNPANGLVKLDYTATVHEELTVTVYDVTGQVLASAARTLTDGVNNLDFDFSALPAGAYFVKLQAGGDAQYKKLVIE